MILGRIKVQLKRLGLGLCVFTISSPALLANVSGPNLPVEALQAMDKIYAGDSQAAQAELFEIAPDFVGRRLRSLEG